MFELMGYKPEHLLGKSLYDFHHGSDSESLMTSFKCREFYFYHFMSLTFLKTEQRTVFSMKFSDFSSNFELEMWNAWVSDNRVLTVKTENQLVLITIISAQSLQS